MNHLTTGVKRSKLRVPYIEWSQALHEKASPQRKLFDDARPKPSKPAAPGFEIETIKPSWRSVSAMLPP